MLEAACSFLSQRHDELLLLSCLSEVPTPLSGFSARPTFLKKTACSFLIGCHLPNDRAHLYSRHDGAAHQCSPSPSSVSAMNPALFHDDVSFGPAVTSKEVVSLALPLARRISNCKSLLPISSWWCREDKPFSWHSQFARETSEASISQRRIGEEPDSWPTCASFVSESLRCAKLADVPESHGTLSDFHNPYGSRDLWCWDVA